MQTRVADLLGIEFPIFAFSHCRDVVAAVTKAGGFGVLGAVAHTPEQLEIDLTWIEEQTRRQALRRRPAGAAEVRRRRARAASTPAGSGTCCPTSTASSSTTSCAATACRAPADEPAPAIRAPGSNISPKGYEPLLDVAFAHHIRLIASALGPPPPDLVERAQDAGRAGRRAGRHHATRRRHAAAGVDLIVAQGTEAGGHTGEIATMVLVPEVVDAVAPMPVLAAGGIGRGRQIAAALALGRRGRVVRLGVAHHRGSRDPPGGEGEVPRRHVVGHGAVAVADRQAGAHAAHGVDRRVGAAGQPGPLGMPLQTALITEPQVRINQAAAHPGAKARELANYFVGQVVGLDRPGPADAPVVLDMVEEFIDTVGRLERPGREVTSGGSITARH